MASPVRPAGIVSIASHAPEKVLTNFDLEKMVDTSDEWIRTRTGIVERHIVADHECTSDLALEASRKAIARAQVSPDEIDLIIVATVTPDFPFPATACLVQERLGASRAGAFDLQAGCTGFIYALTVAAQFVSSGAMDTVLVIGADCLSRITDWTDRTTCVLFGDGAGAAVVRPVEAGRGLLAFDLGSDGSGSELLQVEVGGAKVPITQEMVAQKRQFISMSGNEVFRFAVRAMGESAERAMARCGITSEDVGCYIPHQANLRIIDSAAKRLHAPTDKVIVNVDKYGNTSCASIPLAFDEAVQDGRIKSGDIVVCVGFGAGLTWGSCVIQW
ncbi:MAG: 3-oxoacyl-ACP synthase [Armatimonadetes bacterium CG2_30_59_28]|nr:ketoacyl-ACP synthase III [Armatimonadota bacterium]OIO90797.1 MAG: 3-oxoacyl-ACP synthase [Armatimonadetes bacterium CG2_30_59_28]PIU67522.1 MAG: 3-oxoacyl-ACP synthase [Armatimonadetes bacterium CG07_land_8_20_14_0_80_59_28]PIX45125.1 MAG: 3-oxoacyl-ACP synthase [Armatimonadetes bacterium CG_4_8_14_3_um_filter_58_9]PIY40222.1 MAG: 3-oxoacyl-ACP synthase [Armatimonadetes bacterium CG_4_10_14_3_um_filter_59_10]